MRLAVVSMELYLVSGVTHRSLWLKNRFFHFGLKFFWDGQNSEWPKNAPKPPQNVCLRSNSAPTGYPEPLCVPGRYQNRILGLIPSFLDCVYASNGVSAPARVLNAIAKLDFISSCLYKHSACTPCVLVLPESAAGRGWTHIAAPARKS